MPVEMLAIPDEVEDVFDLDLKVDEEAIQPDAMDSFPPTGCSWGCTQCFCTDITCANC
ncbi:hypothetical protein [Kitasatospora brasiliensis]|uniref:hypothetical protein n=1 Tax=Kitasatospora brasiliensis TaxID=3058040 RepID=UPI002931779B|nr:hypothetical protein [Kitasatospora sp. K002]